MTRKSKFIDADTEAEAFDTLTWACECVQVFDGFQCFEDEADARPWVLKEIETYQTIQRRNIVDSFQWINAARNLAPLFAYMANTTTGE